MGDRRSQVGLRPARAVRHAEVVQVEPGDLGLDAEVIAGFAARVGPLAVVDLETTGLASDADAEILEFGALLVDPLDAGRNGQFSFEFATCWRGRSNVTIVVARNVTKGSQGCA